MFSVPSTPALQTRSAARSRYNSDTPSATHSTSYPSVDIQQQQTSTPTPTRTSTRTRDHTDSSVSSVHTTSPSGVHTPYVQHAAPPSSSGTPQQGQYLSDQQQQQQQQASPSQMPGYQHTPSPPSYGVNASLIVGGSEAAIMPTGNGPECQPLVPNHPDVFMSGKGRPVLRASQTHNGALTPNSATTSWSRRDETHNGHNGHNSHNGQSRLAPLGQNQQHQQQQTHGSVGLSATYPNTPLSTTHEASAPFSHSGGPIATAYSAAPAPPPPSSSHHHSSSHTTQAMSISNSNNGTPYSEDFSFQSSAYPSSYDSSYGSNSPWTPQSAVEHGHHYHQHQHPYYSHMMSSKIEEPILGPDEVPAPRPPMSYAALIGEALLNAPPPHQLYVSEISDSIKRRYSYYRQNPTKVYNGVRHQTSMCKAFVKLPRPFGDQSGGARKWAIRSGCETWFQGGGYHPPGSNAAANLKHKSTSPPLGNNGKAKQTARSKQVAIGTSTSSPKILHAKVKSEPYNPSLGGGGPSVGPAFDGTGKPYYPAFSHAHAHAHAHAPPPPAPYQHQPYGTQPNGNGYYAYHPIQHAPSWQHGYSGQVNGTGAGGMQPPWQQSYSTVNGNPPLPGSPSSQYDTSPQVSAAGPGQHPYSTYSSYAYAQPGSGPGPTPASAQGQGQGQQHPYATQQQQEYKPYSGMAPPHLSHQNQHHSSIFPQSDERPHTQGSPTSQASYEAKMSPNTSERHQSAELSPRH